MTVADLPALNASLNGLAFLLLTAGFIFIKNRRILPHRICMGTAVLVSAIFLVTYVLHKILVGGMHTSLGADGAIRVVYYGMLVSHILLAIMIVPLVVITLRHAMAGRIANHQAWARWTFPIWYYVSITGVLIYFFLYQWFPQQ